MRIAQVDVFPAKLPYKQDFKISRGSVGSKAQGAPHIYVRVQADNGLEGWGEARPSHRWSYETEETVITTLQNYLAPAVMGRDPWDLQGLHEVMGREIAPCVTTGQPVAKSAIDIAVHDLLAKASGVPLARFLGGGGRSVRLARIITTDDPGQAEQMAAQAMQDGYAGFKVKIGLEPGRDIEIVRAVIAGSRPDMFVWADSNQAYDLSHSIRLARALESLEVDVLEQPMPANDLSGLAELRRATSIPIAVDESVFSPRDLIQVIRLRAADWLVMKICKVGGLWPARRCIHIAQEAGMTVLGSGLTESAVGFAANVHLMASIASVLPADFNGPQFIADEPTQTLMHCDVGQATIADTPGHGASLNLSRLPDFQP